MAKTEAVRIDSNILELARSECKKKGIKLVWFVTKAVTEKIQREELKED